MDVFAEFETIAAAFADRKIPYAVIGGCRPTGSDRPEKTSRLAPGPGGYRPTAR